MLVLSRRRNEKIVIPSLNLTVEVLTLRGDSVRLGFDAPSGVAVRRGEVRDEPPAGAGGTGPAGEQEHEGTVHPPAQE
jgi:carbon storage regulator